MKTLQMFNKAKHDGKRELYPVEELERQHMADNLIDFESPLNGRDVCIGVIPINVNTGQVGQPFTIGIKQTEGSSNSTPKDLFAEVTMKLVVPRLMKERCSRVVLAVLPYKFHEEETSLILLMTKECSHYKGKLQMVDFVFNKEAA